MTGYLLDTNVISELRKGRRANLGVISFFEQADSDALYLSVLTSGEIKRGIERIRPRDPKSAQHLEAWLLRLRKQYSDRILPVSEEVALLWGEQGMEQPLPPVDGLIGATAMYHGLTVVTRNTALLERTGIPVHNPFT